MARAARLVLPGHGHWVVQQAVAGTPLVHDDTDRAALLDALRAALARHGVQLWGYALRPDALHLLACPAEAEALGRAMQALGRQYVSAYNRRYDRQGALWSARFRAALLEPGEAVLQVMAEIDRQDAAASGWSSAAHHAGRRYDPLLVDPPEFWALGNTPFEREAAWALRLGQRLPAPAQRQLDDALRAGRVYGSTNFASRVAEQLGRPAFARPVGRPRKQPSAP